MADDDIREGAPKKAKKKAPPPDEDDDDRPRKKRPAVEDDDEEEAPRKKRPAAEDDEDEEEAPRKKKKPVRNDDDEEEGDIGSSPLSAIIPVGGSIFALLSLWLSVIGILLTVASFSIFFKDVLSCVLPAIWPISLLCGGLAFMTHKHKASYGSIAGNMRAIIGILISLVVMAAHGFLVFIYLSK